jgi:hypothetical protein
MLLRESQGLTLLLWLLQGELLLALVQGSSFGACKPAKQQQVPQLTVGRAQDRYGDS